MNKWFKTRKNQLTIVLLGLIILMVFNFILPGYEQLPYYQRKISQLEMQQKMLKNYSLHMKFHEEKHGEFKRNLKSLKEVIFEASETKKLQKELGKLQRLHQLSIIAQKIEKLENDTLFDEVMVNQRLKGKYPNHMQYLQSLASPKTTLVMATCSFQNLNPTRADPDLLMTLEFKYLIPKL